MENSLSLSQLERIRNSFARQPMMATIGAELTLVEAGRVVVILPFDERLTQQHGFVHAGAVGTIADNACGYAAMTLMAAETAPLTVEFKLNLLRPARGRQLTAIGEVVKAGRTLTFCRGEVRAVGSDPEAVVATISATVMGVEGREDVQD